MIKFEDSQIVQILPVCLKNQPEIQAIGYAINNAIKRMIRYSELISVYAAIDNLPEKILDILAIETRVQYYEEDMNIDTKRNIIKNSLLWYQRAGTPIAVKQMIEAVFGVGDIEEWFEYGGEPYFFKIITDTKLSEDIMERFGTIIENVKNTRSHLEKIELMREHWGDAFAAGVFVKQGRSIIREEGIDVEI